MKEQTVTKMGALHVQDNQNITNIRVRLGGEFWANPMEDWRVNNGKAECLSKGGNRSIHSLTHQLTNASGTFNISVKIKRLEPPKDGGAGLRLGALSDINGYRSNCFVHQKENRGENIIS